MGSSYNASMLDFDLSYFDSRNEIQKRPKTKEELLVIKKKIINTDAILQSYLQLKNELVRTRNECKQVRIDHKETTERLRSIENENEKLKKQTKETLHKHNYDNLKLQGLQSHIKQLMELVAEKETKIGSIELEKQLLLSTVQDQKNERKKSLRSSKKEKNPQTSDTVASFTTSDFEIEHAYSIDTGCGSSIASITTPDYSSNNSPMSLDGLSFQKSTSAVSVATSPIDFSIAGLEPEEEPSKIFEDKYTSTQSLVSTSNVAVETDVNEHATSTQCSFCRSNVSVEPGTPKICVDETVNRSSVAVQTQSEQPKIFIDRYTSTHSLVTETNVAVETEANDDVTSNEKCTPAEDMEVQSILHMMTMTFPALSPIPPSPVMLKDACTQFCSEDNYDNNCSGKNLPSKDIRDNIIINQKTSVDSNYVPLLENNSVEPDNRPEYCLSVTPVKNNTNKNNKKQNDLPLSKNTLVDFNHRRNDCSEKSSNKQISNEKQINDLKHSNIQKVLHDLGLSESDSDTEDTLNIVEIVNLNSSKNTTPVLKDITLPKVDTDNVHDTHKNNLQNISEAHTLRNNLIACQADNTVQSPKTKNESPVTKSVSVKINRLSLSDIEEYTLTKPSESNKAVTRKSVSRSPRKKIVNVLDDNLTAIHEKTLKSPKAIKELRSPNTRSVSNSIDCVKNKRVLRKSLSGDFNKNTKLHKVFEDLGFSESDSELSNSAAAEDFTTDKHNTHSRKSQHLTKSTDVAENDVRILRSKSSQRSKNTLFAKTNNSENLRPVRNLKRKCSIELELATKRVLRNNRTFTDSSEQNIVEKIDNIKESYDDNPPVSLRKTRQGSFSNKKPTCNRTLRRHKNSENSDVEIKEIDHKALNSLEKIKPNKPNSPKSRYSRSSESESESTHGRVLRSMSSPNNMPCARLDKNLLLSQNSNLQIDNITYLTRYRLKRLSFEEEEVNSLKEITNVTPVVIQENKGDLQSPLKNKIIPNDTFVPTRNKRLSTYYSPTKKHAILFNPQQTLLTNEATIISASKNREAEIDDTSIPTRKKRISTYIRPLNNNDNNNQTEGKDVTHVDEARNTHISCKLTKDTSPKQLPTNKTEVNKLVNFDEISNPIQNKRISSDVKNNKDEIDANRSNNTEQEILHNDVKVSQGPVRQTRAVNKCRKSLENNDSNIDDIPLSMISYSDLDMFDEDTTPPRPKHPSTVNKSHCQPSNIFFWEMLQKYCGQHTFKRKSHLLTDSAVNTLCETLEVNIARITELPDGFVLFEMKELAHTICNENRKILISAILKYLMSPTRQSDTECRKYTPPAPIMSKQEQVLLYVLDYVREQCQYNIFYDILKSIEYTLFRLNYTPEFVHVQNLSHFYAVICRFVGSVAQLRTFIIDAMYCMSYKAITVVNQCLNVWMHTLPLAHLRTAKNPLVICIVYLLHYFKCENSANVVDSLRNTLQKRYCYDMTEWNETKLLQFIRSCVMSIRENPLEIKNMRCCLILLAKREGVTWCQKNIIEKMLMPIINDSSTPERVKRFSISLLGPIMRPYPNKMKIHCEIVIDQLISIVNTQCCSHNMEETIFRSLIYLNRHNTHKVARALLSWMPREQVSNDFHSHVIDYITEKTSAAWLKILKQNGDY